MPASRSALAKQYCTIVLFGFTIADFLDDPCVRDHHVVELWSGVASIVRAAHKKGLTAVPFDKFRCSGVTDESEDILTKDGFCAAVRCVLSLVVGGLLWMAPVCSSFGWMNKKNCKRSAQNNWKGDETYPSVQEGNLGADIACFLFWLAWAREVQVGMENPSKNDFWKYGSVVYLLEHLQLFTTLTHRCAFDTARFGDRPLKQYKFVATGQWIEKTARACRCPNGVHKSLIIKNAHGVTGIPAELKASGAYPRKLGIAIIEAWDGRFSGSEVGSGVAVHRQSNSSRKRWAQPGSDSSDVQPAVRTHVRRQQSSSSDTSKRAAGRVRNKVSRCSGASSSSKAFPRSSSESPAPVRPSGSRRKWLDDVDDDSE